MKDLTFGQLRVFTEVARGLSFARATEVVAPYPAGRDHAGQELESQVGMPLFERSGRSVALTTVGEYFLV